MYNLIQYNFRIIQLFKNPTDTISEFMETFQIQFQSFFNAETYQIQFQTFAQTKFYQLQFQIFQDAETYPIYFQIFHATYQIQCQEYFLWRQKIRYNFSPFFIIVAEMMLKNLQV